MLTETAICLLELINNNNIKHVGGFYTPSSLIAERLLERLCKNDKTIFKIAPL